MSSEKEYVKNTVILLIGKFCTQFISLLLVPLYTHYLIAKDYGTIDLLQTYITLFVPILTLKLDSAIFRFLVDRRNVDKDKKYSNGCTPIFGASEYGHVEICEYLISQGASFENRDGEGNAGESPQI